MQPQVLPSDRDSFLNRSKEHDPADGSGGTDGATSLLPMGAAPASSQGDAEPSLGPFLLSLQCENLIQQGCRWAGGWCEPPSSPKCGTCTFVLITRCPVIRSRQRRAAATGDSAGGSHSRPQLMTRGLSGARIETMAAELPKAQQTPPWEGAVTAAALGAKMGSLGEPSATREQHWDQPGPPWAADGHRHALQSSHGSMSHSGVLLGHVLWGASLS